MEDFLPSLFLFSPHSTRLFTVLFSFSNGPMIQDDWWKRIGLSERMQSFIQETPGQKTIWRKCKKMGQVSRTIIHISEIIIVVKEKPHKSKTNGEIT